MKRCSLLLFVLFLFWTSPLLAQTDEENYLDSFDKSVGNREVQLGWALKLALYYFQESRFTEMSRWSQIWAELLAEKEINDKTGTIALSLIEKLFKTRRLSEAALFSETVWDKFCQFQSKYRPLFFHNTVLLNLLRRDGKKALEVFGRKGLCGLAQNEIYPTQKELSRYAGTVSDPNDFQQIMEILSLEKKYLPHFLKNCTLLKKSEWAIPLMEKKYQLWSREKVIMEDVDLQSVAKVRYLQFEKLAQRELQIERDKDIQQLAVQIRLKLQILKEITLETQKVVEVGVMSQSIKSYRVLIKQYRELASSLLFITQNDQMGFKEGQIEHLASLHQSLLEQSNFWESEMNSIEKNNQGLVASQNLENNNFKLVDYKTF